jgi:hypothetical protein
MSKQPVLEMLRAERRLKQRVVAKVNHSCAKIIASAPVGVDLAKLV